MKKEITKVTSFVELNNLLEKFNSLDRQEKICGKFCNVGKYNTILMLHEGANRNLFEKICYFELKEEKNETHLFQLIYNYLEEYLFDLNKIKLIINSLLQKGFTFKDIESLRFNLKERDIVVCKKVSLVDFLIKLNELSKEPYGLEVVRYELVVEHTIHNNTLFPMSFKNTMETLGFDKFFELKETQAFIVKYQAQNLLLMEKSFKEAQNNFLGHK